MNPHNSSDPGSVLSGLGRRGFLLGSAAVGAGLALGPVSRAEASPLAGASPLLAAAAVPAETMQEVYESVATPFKHGVVLRADPSYGATAVDSPSVFHWGNTWYMVYIHFIPESGYETLLAASDDLLTWEPQGRILSLATSTKWDRSQAAGYIALQDTTWGGSARIRPWRGEYWLSYLGGPNTGYEAYPLSIGMASTKRPTQAREWERLPAPVLTPGDPDIRNESGNLFKSNVIADPERRLGARFVMYYNAAASDSVERIFMALSDDMRSWQRYGDGPVVDNGTGISGDPQVVKMGDVWVMFYFGAFWRPGAFDTFACSYDLVNWTKWDGPDLIASSEPYDQTYAHKPWVIHHEGVTYHFYTAVGAEGRVIAVATSTDMRRPGDLRVTATYTYPQDSTADLYDGVISYTDQPRNRWTAYQSPNSSDTVTFDWAETRRFTGAKLSVYADGGGVQAPAGYRVEMRVGGAWVPVSGVTRTPEAPADRENVVTFDPIKADAARLVLDHRGGGVYSGLTELEWIEG